jgi:2-polyprenyl-3-methyl-5-hydroxy-6-metoxy-1,4-benzoquinol methylase
MKNADLACIVCANVMRPIFTYREYKYYRCPNCGQVSTYPLPSTSQIREHYARKFHAGNYHLYREFLDEYKTVYRGFVDVLRRDFSARGFNLYGKSVLDVGCFTGEFLELMRDEGCAITGLELQKDAVRLANMKLHGRVFASDVMSDNFPHQKFDIVTLLGVIEHVTDPIKLLHRSFQLLKPGGLIMIQTPNSGSLLAHLAGKYWPPYAPIEHIHLFSHNSLDSALQSQGAISVQFQQHWKTLPLSYIYQQFQNFGPEFYRMLKPFQGIFLNYHVAIHVYGGEMIMLARKHPLTKKLVRRRGYKA